MRKLFQKISSFTLAILVLLSTFSFTVEKYYCGRILVDVAVFSEAKDCGMEMKKKSEEGTKINKKSCCQDELTFVRGQDDLKNTFDQIDFPAQLFVATLIYSQLVLYPNIKGEEINFEEYAPPDLTRDFQVLHETFLI